MRKGSELVGLSEGGTGHNKPEPFVASFIYDVEANVIFNQALYQLSEEERVLLREAYMENSEDISTLWRIRIRVDDKVIRQMALKHRKTEFEIWDTMNKSIAKVKNYLNKIEGG